MMMMMMLMLIFSAVAAVHVFLRLFTTGQPRVIAVGVSSRYILIII